MKSAASGLVAAILLLSTGAQATENCIRASEVEADRVRYVETQLKVAVFQCKDQRHAELGTLYKNFILENRPYLVGTRQALGTYLARAGAASLASYLDQIADRISLESTRVNQFCNRAFLAAELSAKSPHPLTLLPLLPVNYQHPAPKCKPARR